MLPVKPKGKPLNYDIKTMLMYTVGGGIAVGLLLSLSSLVIYFLIGSILLAAFLLSKILQTAIKSAGLRSRKLVIVFSFVIGFTAYTTFHFGNYVQFLGYIHVVNPYVDQTDIESALKADTGHYGFVGYILLNVQEGFSVFDTVDYFDPEQHRSISGSIVWLYWLFELSVLIGVPAVTSMEQTRKPFCEKRNGWMYFRYLGNVSNKNADMFFQAIQDNNVQRVYELITYEYDPSGHMRVEFGDCGKDESGMIRVYSANGKNRHKNKAIFEAMVTPDGAEILRRK